MNVLFVTSGNKTGEPGAVVKNQADSLNNPSVSVKFFLIVGRGLNGYFKAGIKLRKFLKKNNVDIIHAHYTLSGWSAVLGAGKTPVVLSLMGSDTYGEYVAPNKVKLSSKFNTILTYLIQPFVKVIISKSYNIEKYVWLKKKSLKIPNGVSLNTYYTSKKEYLNELGLNKETQYIIFFGDKANKRKNYRLFKEAIDRIKNLNFIALNPFPVDAVDIPKYLNSVNLLVLTSLAEGSPNIVKEAMACNCPIVATDVGDVRWLFGDEPGHFITSFNPADVAEKIKKALKFSEEFGRTNGRQRIIDLGLDSETVAQRIIEVYNEVLRKDK